MRDPIIEAAAQALRDQLGSVSFAGRSNLLPLSLNDVAGIVLTAVTPLIRAAALEEAAVVAEEISPEVFQTPSDIAAAIRALISPSPSPSDASA
jgi:predicted transcriptional regulator